MSEYPVSQDCPRCGSTDVPTLVVRGPSENGVTLRCRDCGDEWSIERAEELRVVVALVAPTCSTSRPSRYATLGIRTIGGAIFLTRSNKRIALGEQGHAHLLLAVLQSDVSPGSCCK